MIEAKDRVASNRPGPELKKSAYRVLYGNNIKCKFLPAANPFSLLRMSTSTRCGCLPGGGRGVDGTGGGALSSVKLPSSSSER